MGVARAGDRLDYLDALRGFAIVAVLLAHSGLYAVTSGIFQTAIAHGARGVQLFFVVSGFTLMWAWERRPESAGRFLTRRFFRIAPMYYLGIVATLALYGLAPRFWAPDGVRILDVLANILFLHAWIPNASFSVVNGGWSLGCEAMFYLAFALLAPRIKSLPAAFLLFVGSVWLAEFTRWHINPAMLATAPKSEVMWAFLQLWPVIQFPAFCAGVLAYFIVREFPAEYRTPTVGAILIGVGVYRVVDIIVKEYGAPLAGDFGLAFACILVGLSISPVRIIVNPVTTLIGRVSYSMYIMHSFFIAVVGPFYSPYLKDAGWITIAIFCVLFLAANTGIAWLTYRYVELPFIRIGASVVARSKRFSRAMA